MTEHLSVEDRECLGLVDRFLPAAQDIEWTYHATMRNTVVPRNQTVGSSRMMHLNIARQDGYKIVGTRPAAWDEAPKTRPAATEQTQSIGIAEKATIAQAKVQAEREAYRDAILALPEAAERPSVAAKIIEAHTLKSMPVHRARAFLAGLPAEPKEAPKPMQQNHTFEKILTRCVEIRTTGLSRKAAMGDLAAKKEIKAINHANQMHMHSPSTPLVQCLREAGADMQALQSMMQRALAR